MATRFNLGKVKGNAATINGTSTLTIEGGNTITATQSGSTLTLDTNFPETSSTLTNDAKLPTGAAVTTALADKEAKLTGTAGDIAVIATGGSGLADSAVSITTTVQNSDSTVPTGAAVAAALSNVSIAVDAALNGSSANPVQNSVITTALNGKQNTITGNNGDIVTIGSGGTPTTTATHTVTVSFTGPNGDSNFTAPSTIVESVMVGKTYNIVSPTIPGYVPTTAIVSGTMSTSDVSTSVAYVRNKATLTVTYTGPSDGVFSAPATHTEQVLIGDGFSVTTPTIATYTPNLAVVAGVMSTSGYSATVTYTKATATLTINFTGPDDGVFTAPSSIIKQVTIGEAYNEVVPAVTDYTPNTATVTGTMTEQGATVTVTYSAAAEIYAFSIDQTESNPASMVTYPGGCTNALYTPAAMNFSTGVFDYGDWSNAFFIKDLKVVVLKDDGTVNYELSKSNYKKKADGTTDSGITSTSLVGNVMVGFPTIWVKVVVTDDNHFTYYISNKQVDNNYHAYMHTDANGQIIDYAYVSAYDTSNTNRSISGSAPTVNITIDQMHTNANARNTAGSVTNVWEIGTIIDRNTINLLLTLISKTTDSQTAFGYGYVANGSSPFSSTNSAAINSGTMDDKGLFWGEHSTGTSGVKVFGIENYWGNVYKRTVGLVSKSSHIYAKYTYGTQDGSTGTGYFTTGDSCSSYIDLGEVANPTGGKIKLMNPTVGGMVQKDNSGSTTTYYCDYGYVRTDTTVGFAGVGGNWLGGLGAGSFFCYVYNDSSHTNSGIGSSLSAKPKK